MAACLYEELEAPAKVILVTSGEKLKWVSYACENSTYVCICFTVLNVPLKHLF